MAGEPRPFGDQVSSEAQETIVAPPTKADVLLPEFTDGFEFTIAAATDWTTLAALLRAAVKPALPADWDRPVQSVLIENLSSNAADTGVQTGGVQKLGTAQQGHRLLPGVARTFGVTRLGAITMRNTGLEDVLIGVTFVAKDQ